MTSHDEPAERIRRADPPTLPLPKPPPGPPPAPLPGPLDLTRDGGVQDEAVPDDLGPSDLGPTDEAVPSDVGWPDDQPRDDVGQGMAALDAMLDAPAGTVAPAATAPAAAGDVPAAAVGAGIADAPTWTAMPVVPIRSDSAASPGDPAAQPAPARWQHADTVARMRADAVAAWVTVLESTRRWFSESDNAVSAMTAAIAIVLIIVVAVLGHS